MTKSDVLDHCRRCGQAVFRDSPNAERTNNFKVDGSPRYMHRKGKCPTRPELWKLR